MERRRQEEEARAARLRESEERRQMLAAAAAAVTSSDEASSSDKENAHHILERAQVATATRRNNYENQSRYSVRIRGKPSSKGKERRGTKLNLRSPREFPSCSSV